MFIQYSTDEIPKIARMFGRAWTQMLCHFECKNLNDLDNKIKILGWRRRQRWQQTDWGYEAKLRRLK